MYEIDFTESEEGRLDDISLYTTRLERMIEELEVEGDFSITYLSDDEIRRLNAEYRDKDEATDVLTFRLKDDDTFPDFGLSNELGDVFISLDAVARNAAEFSVPFEEELTRVMLHGLMHLMGYDHQSNDFKSEQMLIKQEEILRKLGYAG